MLNKEQKIEKASKILELYAEGEYTIESCCKAVGVKDSTFRDWSAPKIVLEDITPEHLERLERRGFVREIHEMYIQARASNEINFAKLMKSKAREGLLKSLTGYTETETRTQVRYRKDPTTGQMVPEPVGAVTTEKYIPPNVTAIIFTLKNSDPENFADERTLNVIAKDERTLKKLGNLSDEELDKKLLELQGRVNELGERNVAAIRQAKNNIKYDEAEIIEEEEEEEDTDEDLNDQ